MVKVYTSPTCVWCKKVKEFLKEHKVKYIEVDVASNREAAKNMVEKTGQMGVPVTEVDGKFIVGFNESELKKALKIK